jgi:hypothetical protein
LSDSTEQSAAIASGLTHVPDGTTQADNKQREIERERAALEKGHKQKVQCKKEIESCVRKRAQCKKERERETYHSPYLGGFGSSSSLADVGDKAA